MRRGVSDLIVVLALISIAIPVAVVMQHWLSSQVGRATSYSSVPAVIANLVSTQYRDSNVSIVVSVENRGSNNLNLNNINVKLLLENGSAVNGTSQLLSGSSTLAPGGKASVMITASNIGSKVTLVIMEVKDSLGNTIPVEIAVG